MRTSERRSNLFLQVELLIERLLDAPARRGRLKLRKAIEANCPESQPARLQLRLPQGRIQATVVDVLAAATSPLYTREVHAQVQKQLQRAISYDTVASCLSVMSRDSNSRVTRIGRGLYIVDER